MNLSMKSLRFICTALIFAGAFAAAAQQPVDDRLLRAWAATVAGTTLTTLPFHANDAEYSPDLNRIIVVGESPNKLYAVDPDSGATLSVDLAASPTCVSVSPDGKFAAV